MLIIPTRQNQSLCSWRVTGAKVVIHEDITDRPLYEELLRCGIPSDKIVLAYAGETLPEETPPTP